VSYAFFRAVWSAVPLTLPQPVQASQPVLTG
jgi:hypothetical protein